MQSLRSAKVLARLVLAWFALFVGVAVASPAFKPQSMELVCSGAGIVKMLAKGGDTSRPGNGHTLDCPLCAPFDAPAGAAQGIEQGAPLGHVLHPWPAARIAALVAPALPARGPPSALSI